MKFLNFLKPVGDLLKPVSEIFKDNTKKVSSKRVFTLGGGGALILQGIAFLQEATSGACETSQASGLIAGGICIASGVLTAVLLSEKIKEINIEKGEE